MVVTGKIVGYDPGGNDHHGVAKLVVDNGRPVDLSFTTVRNAQAALQWFTAGDLPPIERELLVQPGGESRYYWPLSPSPAARRSGPPGRRLINLSEPVPTPATPPAGRS